MFLTKIFLSAENCWEQKITDDYSLHRLVYSFFPLTAEPQRFLYADRGPVDGGRSVLILSAQEPDIPAQIQSSAVLISESFLQAKHYRFEVILNPVKRNPLSHKRLPITGMLPLLSWFMTQSEKWGFLPDEKTLEVSTLPSKVFQKDNREFRFHHVLFQGRIQVLNTVLFRQNFFAGLGHGKAFGFGLLQLRPIADIHAFKATLN